MWKALQSTVGLTIIKWMNGTGISDASEWTNSTIISDTTNGGAWHRKTEERGKQPDYKEAQNNEQ